MKSLDIYVLVPPTVENPGEVERPEVIHGKTLRMRCPANGIPPPTITWFINNKAIRNNTERLSLLEDGWTLEITNIQETDTDRYICKAENMAGQIEKNFDVNVLCKIIFKYYFVFLLRSAKRSAYLKLSVVFL